MTDAEKELRRLAQEATPGPWDKLPLDGTWHQRTTVVDGPSGDPVAYARHPNDALYIAAANPAAVLALLDHIEALEKESRDWQDYADEREKHWQGEVAQAVDRAERKGSEDERQRRMDAGRSIVGPLPGDAP